MSSDEDVACMDVDVYSGPFHDNAFGYFDVIEHPLRASDKSKRPDPTLRCKFCKEQYVSCGLTRARTHLTKSKKAGIAHCKKVPTNVRDRLRAQESAFIEKDSKAKKNAHHDAITSDVAVINIARKRQATLPESLRTMDHALVHEELARCFYANGLPFTLVRDPHFLRMLKAVGSFGSSYTPP
jgi:hypothetical protein